MVNTKGGKEYKKYKHRSKDNNDSIQRCISKVDYDGSIYAKIDNLLGNNILLATGENKIVYKCVIRGRMLNKERMYKGDYIIILPRDFEKRNFADICHKCNELEINKFDIDRLFEFLELNENTCAIIFDTTNDENNEEYDFDKL